MRTIERFRMAIMGEMLWAVLFALAELLLGFTTPPWLLFSFGVAVGATGMIATQRTKVGDT